MGLESTIVGFPEGRATVYRKGGLAVEQIAEVLGYEPAVRTNSSSRPAAPGMLSRHYSPGLRMELFDRLPVGFTFPPGSAWVRFGGAGIVPVWAAEQSVSIYDLSPRGDLTEAAQQLFALLRLLGDRQYAYVAVERLPETGLGRAINDRLTRAAATD